MCLEYRVHTKQLQIGKSLVVVDVIYIYIMFVWHCGLRLMFVCVTSRLVSH